MSPVSTRHQSRSLSFQRTLEVRNNFFVAQRKPKGKAGTVRSSHDDQWDIGASSVQYTTSLDSNNHVLRLHVGALRLLGELNIASRRSCWSRHHHTCAEDFRGVEHPLVLVGFDRIRGFLKAQKRLG